MAYLKAPEIPESFFIYKIILLKKLGKLFDKYIKERILKFPRRDDYEN